MCHFTVFKFTSMNCLTILNHKQNDYLCVVVHSGCHNKMPQALCLKHENFIFSSSGGWEPVIRVPSWLDSEESFLPGLWMASSASSRHGRGREERRKGEREREKGSERERSDTLLIKPLTSSCPPHDLI